MNCRVTEGFLDVVNLLQEEARKPRDYGNGVPLTHSEVGFLGVVHRDPDANVSRISQALGLTKGAITQTTQKLSQKGLVEQYQRSHNKKEKYFRLTELGELARSGHERFHEDANRRLCAYFSSLEEGEARTILDFLAYLKECMPFCAFPCRCGEDESKEEYYGSDAIESEWPARCAGRR